MTPLSSLEVLQDLPKCKQDHNQMPTSLCVCQALGCINNNQLVLICSLQGSFIPAGTTAEPNSTDGASTGANMAHGAFQFHLLALLTRRSIPPFKPAEPKQQQESEMDSIPALVSATTLSIPLRLPNIYHQPRCKRQEDCDFIFMPQGVCAVADR